MILETDKAIENAIRVLLKGNKIVSESWQAQKDSFKMIEVSDIFLKMQMCKNIEELSIKTKADLPWSEDHFNERLAGSSNPGEQYKNWPYYKHEVDNNRFRKEELFSHTYQERFWPPKIKGIRFEMGDYNDVKERLKDNHTTRQAFLAIWHPEDQTNHGERLPCTIGYWFNIKNNKLNITYLIRSCDASRHFRNDIYMAQRLAYDIIEYLGDNTIEPGILSMWIGSFHSFESDVYHLTKKLNQ